MIEEAVEHGPEGRKTVSVDEIVYQSDHEKKYHDIEEEADERPDDLHEPREYEAESDVSGGGKCRENHPAEGKCAESENWGKIYHADAGEGKASEPVKERIAKACDKTPRGRLVDLGHPGKKYPDKADERIHRYERTARVKKRFQHEIFLLFLPDLDDTRQAGNIFYKIIA